jgi:hypothetical protein
MNLVLRVSRVRRPARSMNRGDTGIMSVCLAWACRLCKPAYSQRQERQREGVMGLSLCLGGSKNLCNKGGIYYVSKTNHPLS